MKKIISLCTLVLTLAVLLVGGVTRSWFVDSVEVQDAVFTARIPIETKRIYELNVGDRVVDNGWTWEFRTGNNYTGVGEVKPLVWVVAAKDQYVAAPAVLLLSSEVVARGVYHPTSNSLWRDSQARDWVNGAFYNAFSPAFKGAILPTNLPNIEINGRDTYVTSDNVFLLTTTELGRSDGPEGIMEIGSVTSYYNVTNLADRRARRRAQLGGVNVPYWTRTPKGTRPPQNVWYVQTEGQLIHNSNDSGTHMACNTAGCGYRPALNMNGETLVRVVPNTSGVYEIYWP